MIMRMHGIFSMLLASMVLLQVVPALTAVEPSKPPPPVAKWTFEKEPMDKSLGAVRFDGDGPRSPIYPAFTADNKALVLEAPAWLSIADEPQESRFDFDNGDAITLEAWVKPASFTGPGNPTSPKPRLWKPIQANGKSNPAPSAFHRSAKAQNFPFLVLINW